MLTREGELGGRQVSRVRATACRRRVASGSAAIAAPLTSSSIRSLVASARPASTVLPAPPALLGQRDRWLGSRSGRLDRLVDHGLLERVPYQDRPPRFEYHPTAKGSELLVVLLGRALAGAGVAICPARTLHRLHVGGVDDGAHGGRAVNEPRSPIARPGVLARQRRAAGLGSVTMQGSLGDDAAK